MISANPLSHNPEFKRPPTKKPFENIVGKGENAGNQHFLLFPQCFLPFTKQISKFQSRLFCRLHMLSILSFGRVKQNIVRMNDVI